MNNESTLAKAGSALARTASLIFGMPFDVARANYAKAVRFGLIPDSLLRSAVRARACRCRAADPGVVGATGLSLFFRSLASPAQAMRLARHLDSGAYANTPLEPRAGCFFQRR